ncbi:dihydrodipicolinate synthase family protein [Paracoccus sp. M683]|uniref:dihydrodipicolinate synthase family protein n=1 Tax=Paracoccus sp. M683 TaxID=2594268 RepID=UPI00117E4037|nr:dihydrodipicolinate synthase family protein [Paracoccus sp. M683]TRW97817.1 dihydrodipicolinate synthase family protein [Paracoccus sp. M683]
MSLFHGLSAFPITPADADGRVDAAALGRVLAPLADAQVDSVGLLGSTGSYAYLTRAERQRILDLAVESLAGRVPLIVGVGAMRTDDAVALAEHAQGAGADGLLLAPVSYTPLTDDEAFQHFAAVAGASSLPLCIYNNPSTTHFTFSLPLLARLAQLPTVAAVKMPLPADGDYHGEIARLRAALPQGFAVGYSGDWGALPSLLAGADCFFSVAGGTLPGPFLALVRAAMAGEAEAATRIDAKFAPLWALFREYGSIRVVHAAARLMGLADSDPQLPVLPLSPDQTARVAAALATLNDC